MHPILRLAAVLALAGPCLPAQVSVVHNGPNMRLQSSSVSFTGGVWKVLLAVEDDNGNTSLPNSWRRWWHCGITGLAGGEALDVEVRNAGYSDVILPVWSRSSDGGRSFGPWQRCPTSATPTVAGSTHRFTLTVPAGVTDLRLAKWYPYLVADKDAFLGRIAGHPHVRSITSLGTSHQGRTIERVTLTDAAVPDAGKERVWIHAGIHPAENTGYFTVEGFVDFLLGSTPTAELLLDHTIVDVVPMANPDGVYLGNYRTNAASVNLEAQWAAPYNSPQPEIVALRTAIENAMGTAASPGRNPITVLLNLHASHNLAFPFHFQHQSNPSWNPLTSPSGVLPVVHALEGRWIAAFRAASPFVALGSTLSSSCGSPARPFVECMMHDRWSSDPSWTGVPNAQEPVMAITYEGTYGRGPDGVTWNTPGDDRQNGREMAHALRDHLGLVFSASLTPFAASCGSPALSGSVQGTSPNLSASVAITGAPPGSLAWLAIGFTRTTVPLPLGTCALATDVAFSRQLAVSGFGTAATSLPIPQIPGLVANLQAVVLDPSGSAPVVTSSNALELRNHY